jgi:hypothetical protein
VTDGDRPLETALPATIGGVYRWTWPVTGVQIDFEHFAEHREGLWAEAVFAQVIGERVKFVTRARLNLLSSPNRQSVLRDLTDSAPGVPWLKVLQHACFLATERHRAGDPPLDLMAQTPVDRRRFALKPYVEHAGPTTLFGAGGAGKTYLADAMAVSVAADVPVVGFPQAGHPENVLLLDWESDADTHYERIMAIQTGHNITENLDGRVFYLQMRTPLATAAGWLTRFVAEKRIGLAFGDSLSLACGGELEASADILRTFGAARSLGCPFVFVTHITNTQATAAEENGGKGMRPFGSVFTVNQSRNCWSVVGAGEPGDLVRHVGLRHTKSNWRYQKEHAYQMRFENDPGDEDRVAACTFAPVNPLDVAAFANHAPLTERILRDFQHGALAIADVIQRHADEKPDTVRTTVSNLKKKGLLFEVARGVYGRADEHHAESA